MTDIAVVDYGMGNLRSVAKALAHVAPEAMVRVFSADPQVVGVGADYLRIASWNFVASGIVFISSSMFQAMGHTLPSLVTSFMRIVVVTILAFGLAPRPGFQLRWMWYLSVASVTLQAVTGLMPSPRYNRESIVPTPSYGWKFCVP